MQLEDERCSLRRHCMLPFSPNHQTMHYKSVCDLIFSDWHIRLIILELDRISFARFIPHTISPPHFLPTFSTLAAGRSCIGKMHRVLPGWIRCLDMFGYAFSTQGSRILDFGTVESLRFSPQRWLEKKNEDLSCYRFNSSQILITTLDHPIASFTAHSTSLPPHSRPGG